MEGEVKRGPSTSPTPLWPPSLKDRVLLSQSEKKRRALKRARIRAQHICGYLIQSKSITLQIY